MKIYLRPAAINDVPVLKHWDSQPHVLKARNLTEPDTEWNWEAEINRAPSWRELLIGEVDNRPVAFLQIIDPQEEDTHYWGDVPQHQRAIDIWIGEEQDLGNGYGTVMMQLTLDRCFADETVQKVVIDPLEENKRAHIFYEKLGFKFVAPRMFGEDRCYVYEMHRSEWIAAAKTQPNVTCAGGMLVKEGQFLLGKRSAAASWYPEVWDVFGGHAEQGEAPVQTLLRELREELAIVPTRYQLAAVFTYFKGCVQKKVQYHHYFITEWTGELQKAGTEHTEIRWFDRSELVAIPLAAKEYLPLIDAWMHTAGGQGYKAVWE